MTNDELFEGIVAANPDVFEVENEECPMGDDCAIHFRNQERHRDDELKYSRFIDYVGAYCVVTDSAPLTQADALKAMLNVVFNVRSKSGEEIPDEDLIPSDDYQTEVIYVGEGKSLADLGFMTEAESRKHVKHVHTFNKYGDFAMEHNKIVEAVRKGVIPVSE